MKLEINLLRQRRLRLLRFLQWQLDPRLQSKRIEREVFTEQTIFDPRD